MKTRVIILSLTVILALLAIVSARRHTPTPDEKETARVARVEERLNGVGIPGLVRTSGNLFYVILRREGGVLHVRLISSSPLIAPLYARSNVETSAVAKTVVEVAAWDEEEKLDLLLRKFFEAEMRDASTRVPTVKLLTAPTL